MIILFIRPIRMSILNILIHQDDHPNGSSNACLSDFSRQLKILTHRLSNVARDGFRRNSAQSMRDRSLAILQPSRRGTKRNGGGVRIGMGVVQDAGPSLEKTN